MTYVWGSFSLFHINPVLKNIYVSKASGEQVPFSIRKLRKSLHKGGASEETVHSILGELRNMIYPGITTEEIYQKAFDLMRDANAHWAGKYKLKRAIQELGPSGFPFEKYLARLLHAQGYDTETGVVMPGLCVSHEVDVVASKDKETILVECKFHSLPGNQSDVKIPLYIKSRFDDIHERKIHDGKDASFRRWVVTNTRFTGDAMRYGQCAGLHLISWDYPEKGSLRQIIDKRKLYPLTCLSSLSDHEKNFLLDHDIVLVNDLANNELLLKKAGVSKDRIRLALEEAAQMMR